MKLISWNVNSIRNSEEKFLKFMELEQPDIMMIQEVRAFPYELSFFLHLVEGYDVLFNPSSKAGYSGTGLYWKKSLGIKNVTDRPGNQFLDSEGRTIVAFQETDHMKRAFINFYTPNGGAGGERFAFKLNFYSAATAYAKSLLEQGYDVVIGGDLNVAHTPLDLYAPKLNENHSGFLLKERQWIDDLIALGFSDTFRLFEKEGGHYSWWNMRDPQRVQNQGWRFDYFLTSKKLTPTVTSARILCDVFGSDHCPVMVELS